MKQILFVLQIIVSTSLIIIILLQSRGSGLGTVFGGSDSIYRSKRGIEKFFVYFTVFLTILFLILAILLVII